jgi:predicted component of type VI protein secretion system
LWILKLSSGKIQMLKPKPWGISEISSEKKSLNRKKIQLLDLKRIFAIVFAIPSGNPRI